MWLGNLTRQQYKEFLLEHAEEIMDSLLKAHSYTLDAIVMDELQEELEEYCETESYWEAC